MIYLGGDHAGFKLKKEMAGYLESLGYEVTDLGNKKLEPKDDYPDFAFRVGQAVGNTGAKGILFCGSAEGVCIAANKVAGVRAVNPATAKLAKLSREHNDANVLCLSGWEMPPAAAKKIISVWLKTKFTGEARHLRRIKKISRFEKSSCCGSCK